MKIKLLLGVSLFAIPYLACATETIQFNLINISSSRSINVTAGYIIYAFWPMGMDVPAGCPTWDNPVKVDLNSITQLPLSISPETEGKITYTFPSNLDDCFKSAYLGPQLYISQIDGINKPEGPICGVSGYVMSATDSMVYASMNIIKTTDSFYCNPVY